jgi:beta-N-acetylhexosaminidase
MSIVGSISKWISQLIIFIVLIAFCTMAVQYRNPSFAAYRYLIVGSMLIIVSAIALFTLSQLRSKSGNQDRYNQSRPNSQPIRRWTAFGQWLSLVLSAICLTLLLTQEGKFLWTKYSVLNHDPSQLQRLGQHFIVGYRNFGEIKQLVEKQAIAGIFITARNVESQTIAAVQQQIQTLQSIRQAQNLPPLWVATDQEGGVVSNLSPPLPYQPSIAEAIANTPIANQQQAVIQYATLQAQALQQLGVTVNFSPVVDLKKAAIAGDRFSLISRRAIAADPVTVGKVATWYCETLAQFKVQCTVKHFPGLGSLKVDTHTHLAKLDVAIAQLETEDWIPFRALINRELTSRTSPQETTAWMMLGHVVLPELDPTYPASFSQKIVTDLIRQKWNYGGILVTDDVGMQAAYQHPEGFDQMVVRSLNAGVDIILDSFDTDLFYPAMQALMQAEQLGQLDQQVLKMSQERLTRTNGEKALILRAQSARKISALNKKCTSGMLPHQHPSVKA